MTPPRSSATLDMQALADQIKYWCRTLGFQQAGITDTDLGEHAERHRRWLAAGYHGEMAYMARHGDKRTHPELLVEGTQRIIVVRMDYLPPEVETTKVLSQPQKAYISRYALGRDYHKVIRKRLSTLAKWIENEVGAFGHRAFVDSAPVLERGLAQNAGLGWTGKNSLILHPKAGSLFFIGELFTDLPLPIDPPFETHHCGKCQRCRDLCPTQAIVDDQVVDARRCISYLTIELNGPIPEEFRSRIGNRVYGCDDCQLVCPFTRFVSVSQEDDFAPRHDLDRADLLTLFNVSEPEFLEITAGSAIRRIGYIKWLRNLAVGLGNAPYSAAVVAALEARLAYPSDLVREHVRWALAQQAKRRSALIVSAPA